MRNFKWILLLILPWYLASCTNSKGTTEETALGSPSDCFSNFSANTTWGQETVVPISGYSGNAMEPKVSADQVVLFWNDKPSTDEQMNLHYAVKISNVYVYQGTVTGTVDGSHLDGVPAIDSVGNFYFVSMRNYSNTFQTLYSGTVQVTGAASLQINSVASADTVASSHTNGTVDMDLDVSWDGQLAVVSRATFSGAAYPDTSRLKLFDITSRNFSNRSDSDSIFENVNKNQCRIYAGSFSRDKLEVYFTILPTNQQSASSFRIGMASRSSTSAPFANPQILTNITGNITEGPTPTYDDNSNTLFYHKFDSASNTFKIYKVTRP